MRALLSTATVLACLLLAACGDAVPNSAPDAPKANEKGLLAGLLQPGASPTQDGPTRPQMPPPLSRASLAGGDVVVAAPEGYCIDPTTVQTGQARGFALIASCQILSGGRTGAWAEPILISVAVGPKGAEDDLPTPGALASATGAELLGGQTTNGFVTANLDRGGEQMLSGGDTRYWRGAFVQNGRLVGLALYAPKGNSLAAQQGGAMLSRVKARIEAVSAAGSGQNTPRKPKGGGGLLDRLFN